MKGFIYYIPEDLATTPAEGHCFVNRWWSVHPEHGVAFYADNRRSFFHEPGDEEEPSPQCNSDEFTARELTRRSKPDCIVKFIPAVYLRHAITEMHKQRKARREASALSSTDGKRAGAATAVTSQERQSHE